MGEPPMTHTAPAPRQTETIAASVRHANIRFHISAAAQLLVARTLSRRSPYDISPVRAPKNFFENISAAFLKGQRRNALFRSFPSLTQSLTNDSPTAQDERFANQPNATKPIPDKTYNFSL